MRYDFSLAKIFVKATIMSYGHQRSLDDNNSYALKETTHCESKRLSTSVETAETCAQKILFESANASSLSNN